MYNPFVNVINQLLPEPQASLLSGMLFGIRADIPAPFYQDLIATGVIHVIALSGTNISILIDIVAKATGFLGKKDSALVSIVFIICFVLFVGPSPTIVRAAIMGSMSMIAIYFGRQYWALLSLFLTSGIMLLVSPSWVLELTFQLSFLATLGIILANKVVERETSKRASKQLLFLFKENLVMTVSAQLFTMPIIVYHFERISLIAPVANLAIVWSITPIMIFGMMTSLLGLIWLPLAYIPALVSWVFLTYFVKAVEIFSNIPGASIAL